MKRASLAHLVLSVCLQAVAADTTSSESSSSGFRTISSINAQLTNIPSDPRATYPSDIPSTAQSSTNSTAGPSSFNQTSTQSSSSPTETLLHGSSATSTSVAASSSDTARCNGYAEFCDRKYSNVTYVVAHNSPFHKVNNAASNQDFDVTTQLDNGIRGIQSETHFYQNDVYLCHTSCDELNAGTLEQYLTTVKQWLDNNRYEVITIILGNEDFINPGNYVAPFTKADMLDYVYVPPAQPMDIEEWPTLADMIISNKRLVVMLAYDANQQSIPWLLDMWSYQWQTPFSPTNASFPCSVQRPPGQDRNVSEYRLYLANHNLNVEIELSIGSSGDILVPDIVQLNSTNANNTDFGSAELAVQHCTEEWGRPPNFLLVDYYNRGNFNGSTLAVAAKANNVTYDSSSCCGKNRVASNGETRAVVDTVIISFAAILVTIAVVAI